MLRAILNKSWRQHPTRHQLYGHLPPITKTIQVRRARHAGHCWRSRDELISDVLLWTPTYGRAKAGRPARTYIQQLCEDTGCSPEEPPEAMNDREKRRERVKLAARHDDDDQQTITKGVKTRHEWGRKMIHYELCKRLKFDRTTWPIYRTLTGATSPRQNEPMSDANKGVLRIPQSSSIIGTSPSDCLLSYPGQMLVGGPYPCAEKQSVYSTAPADWTKTIDKMIWSHKYG